MKIIIVEKCAFCPYRENDNTCSRTMEPIKNIHTIPDNCPLEDDIDW